MLEEYTQRSGGRIVLRSGFTPDGVVCTMLNMKTELKHITSK